MASTLLLNRQGWDACLDASGNVALATEPYSQVQDAASACRVFRGEEYYNTAAGVPYFTAILGKFQPTQILKASLEAAALGVPGVTAARVILSAMQDRTLSGQVQIMTASGPQVANF